MSENIFVEIYERLFRHFGPQHWWPGESPFEVCVGAILTQNTNWQNVERAIKNLKDHELLSPHALYDAPPEVVANLIKPAGYFRVKTKRLKNFIKMLVEEFEGDLDLLFELGVQAAREKLLSVSGIGPETADSILLYAGNLPIFVIDAYTRRILLRHGLATEEMDYHELQKLFMDNLPEDVSLFNEYHALLVATGKNYCRPKKPICSKCPLEGVSY
ncbi:endonuclease III domain-containing protein [Thermodesulfatator atlanticus]|uniref:endonuclease III domain-containing protein n=1 Tax=Thermodesulfatator atlanticus TaxID=501497 RepID=UPI0003B4273B|nr:endonuclease III domain-containing protein [Thermodesulfatator atlanticus]